MSIFLERKTTKTSKNSSIPPSQTRKDKTSKKQESSQSKGPKSNDDMFSEVKTTEEIKTAEVNFCTHCGQFFQDLSFGVSLNSGYLFFLI